MYINSKKKSKLMKRRIKEEQFIRNNPAIYSKYKNRGFSHEKSVVYAKKEISRVKVRKGTKSLEKLKQRFHLNMTKPGVASIDISDIPRTKAVNIWIQDKVYEGEVIDKGYQLKFPRNVELGRY